MSEKVIWPPSVTLQPVAAFRWLRRRDGSLVLQQAFQELETGLNQWFDIPIVHEEQEG